MPVKLKLNELTPRQDDIEPDLWLSRFEQKIIDDLAITIIDPFVRADAIEHQAEQAAQLLKCTLLQAAVAGAKQAMSVAQVTRRYEGFFGHGDLFFDLDEARETLYRSSSEGTPTRPDNWGPSGTK